MPKTIAEQFWTRVDHAGDPCCCWLWLGALDRDGYGIFSYRSGPGETRTVRAHRFAWSLANGRVPSGMQIHHACRIRACMRPGHLQEVTDVAHKRIDGRCWLSENDVLAIRLAYGFGSVTQQELASRFGIAQAYVSQILLGKKWRHLV